jgi:hypothetical protein
VNPYQLVLRNPKKKEGNVSTFAEDKNPEFKESFGLADDLAWNRR